ncbi:kinase-like protein [Tilletiaria anomala UBC 951]|uniref:Kinase-like protein n=1 Tax=Tilletiaria anomala (strain ATCC 24038 / CBS 436.72 / UBC 951) TaxID=1037660 RepID=A0A066WHF5_TILAU|nr:kinase-like protein [Tilletiaria anomala UBC 951]KDN53412.1 kinase-like protein [Tilletiaria anomala UBC 951]
MTNPSTASLSRLLKAQLLQLCEERGLHVDADLKKADLVQTLISSPPTPALTPTNAQAQPAEAVDELNGLDLESLNLVDKEIAASKLEKLEKIGSGGFKDVYVGKYKVSKARSMKVAIADLRDQLTEMDIKELSLLRDLKHENIVRFIGVSIPDDPRNVPCMIVSELCSNGDLFDYIRNVPAPSDSEIYRILLEIARGLEYLHLRKPAIIHRDVKSTNVLITRDRTAKINDFGLARVKNTTRSMVRSLVGTVNWQAVELWVPKPHYNEKVDVWSAAMTFWEVLQWHQPEKRYPFQGMNEHQIYQDVGQKRQRCVAILLWPMSIQLTYLRACADRILAARAVSLEGRSSICSIACGIRIPRSGHRWAKFAPLLRSSSS